MGNLEFNTRLHKAIPTTDSQQWEILIVVQDISSLHRQVKKSESLRKQALHESTIRKEMQEQTLRLHLQNQYLLEAVGEGIYGVDIQGMTTFVNPAAATMLGYSPEELIGVPMHTTVHHSTT